MERAPKQEIELEKGIDGWWELKDDPVLVEKWKQLKADAPAQTDDLIAHIEGFDDMSVDEKLRALQSLLITLSTENNNRVVVEPIAEQMMMLERENAYRKAAELAAQTPSGRVLTQA